MAYGKNTFDIEVLGERSILENLDQMPEMVKDLVRSKVEYFAEELKNQVIDNIDERLSKTYGSKEKQYSGAAGHLRDAIEIEYDSDGLEAVIYVDGSIPYARIQEDGGIIPPHIIRPREGKALAFEWATAGKKVILAYVFMPSVTIPGQHYLRDAYRMFSPKIGKAIQKAVVEGIRQNMRNVG